MKYIIYSSRLSTGLSRTPRSRRKALESWPRVSLKPAFFCPKIPFPHARTRLRKNFPQKVQFPLAERPRQIATRRLTFTQMLPRSIKLPIACADFAPSLWSFQTLVCSLFLQRSRPARRFTFKPAVVLGPAPHPPCRITSEPVCEKHKHAKEGNI